VIREVDIKCEVCGMVESVPLSELELAKTEGHWPDVFYPDLKDTQWLYCRRCGGIAKRVWSAPAVIFKGGGFTKGS
jgi:predicted nucleic acid-binding Zn ribbon protein